MPLKIGETIEIEALSGANASFVRNPYLATWKIIPETEEASRPEIRLITAAYGDGTDLRAHFSPTLLVVGNPVHRYQFPVRGKVHDLYGQKGLNGDLVEATLGKPCALDGQMARPTGIKEFDAVRRSPAVIDSQTYCSVLIPKGSRAVFEITEIGLGQRVSAEPALDMKNLD